MILSNNNITHQQRFESQGYIGQRSSLVFTTCYLFSVLKSPRQHRQFQELKRRMRIATHWEAVDVPTPTLSFPNPYRSFLQMTKLIRGVIRSEPYARHACSLKLLLSGLDRLCSVCVVYTTKIRSIRSIGYWAQTQLQWHNALAGFEIHAIMGCKTTLFLTIKYQTTPSVKLLMR